MDVDITDPNVHKSQQALKTVLRLPESHLDSVHPCVCVCG